MNMLALPRNAAALEYKVLRYPSQLIETRVVATLLSEDSTVRLAFERLLGVLDSAAGSLFADQALKDRGRMLTHRAEILEKAVSLETKAAQRKQRADAELRVTTEQAEADKEQARQERQRELQQVSADKHAAKAAVDKAAQDRKAAEKKAIAAETAADVAAERTKAEARKAQIEQRTEAATASSKAELSKAVEDTRAAQQEKADADRLASLAAAERASRTS